MHSIWFDLELDRDITLEEVKKRLRDNPRVAMTDKRYANLIFSFGRDHGYYGRILSQTVVVMPTLTVRQQARGLRLLLHAPGRQLAALLGRGDPLAHRSRLAERAEPPAADPPLAVPGDLTARSAIRRPYAVLAARPVILYATRRAQIW